MEKTRKPTVAGILDIISAVFVLGQGFGCLLQWHLLEARVAFAVIVIAGLLAIIGGIYTLRRKIWGLALAGSICATLSLYTFYLGIIAIIFTARSRNEFE
ncbi:hypothetical protein ACFLTY_04535 [Chloroflexota bacterium]